MREPRTIVTHSERMTRAPANNPCADGFLQCGDSDRGRLCVILRLWPFDPPQEIKKVNTLHLPPLPLALLLIHRQVHNLLSSYCRGHAISPMDQREGRICCFKLALAKRLLNNTCRAETGGHEVSFFSLGNISTEGHE